MNIRSIVRQLGQHAPFTALGTLSSLFVILILSGFDASLPVSLKLFWALHPLHVLVSALVTTALYRQRGGRGFWPTFLIGYAGSVGIATVSDSLIPFAGEWLLHLPNRGVHIGFIEKWWLVNPLALGGILLAVRWPRTRIPHMFHVMLSTWASLFHIMAAQAGGAWDTATLVLITAFLFLSVWVPCCTSDIVFPLLFVTSGDEHRASSLNTRESRETR